MSGLRSPKGHALRQLEGNAADIDAQARDLVSAAQVMRDAAGALERLADGTDTISVAESMDEVRGSAGDVAPQLRKAAIRYDMTGESLITYAAALEEAQNQIRPMIEDIGEKHEAWRAARDKVVLNPYQDLADLGAGETGPGLSQAVTVAEGELQEAWAGLDRVFGVWEDAYDKAVDGIDDAFDAADNNDAWGEDWLDVLGYVGAALCVVALLCSGPVALVIGAIGLLVGAAILAITIMKRSKGRGSNADLAWAIVGMVPFVRPLTTAKGAIATLRGAKAAMAGGKTTLGASVRATVRPTMRPLRPGAKPRTRPPSKIDKIANKRTTGLLGNFNQSNSWVNRVKMNVFGGGHSDLTAFGNFIRGEGASKVGSEAVEWAAENAPEVSRLMKRLVGGEVATSFTVAVRDVSSAWQNR